MVLNRWALWVAAVAIATAACKQSLFDNHGPGTTSDGGGGDDGGDPDMMMVPSSCAAPCLADAAGDFNGTATGARGNWRYLDDHRDRTWLTMAITSTMPALMTGVDPRNHITTCKDNPMFPACQQLPGSLLISSSGMSSNADPAIEFTVATSNVIQITLRVFVPGNVNQQIRLYRNSREDALYTGIATSQDKLEKSVALDALAGDRFLLAMSPTAAGAANVAVQLFASATGAVFPASCQLAVSFDGATGSTVSDRCKTATLENFMDGATMIPVVLQAGPFAEAKQAARIAAGTFLRDNTPVDHSGDVTVQLWMRQAAVASQFDAAWAFSDLDLDHGGGLGVDLSSPIPGQGTKLDVSTVDGNGAPIDLFVDYPNDGSWQFVRAVHTGGNVDVCLNGVHRATMPLAAGKLATTYAPYLGRNVIWPPTGSFFDGQIDDVRVFNVALPCE
jgi:Concanavalin A-like lectin/glucanases superfamily